MLLIISLESHLIWKSRVREALALRASLFPGNTCLNSESNACSLIRLGFGRVDMVAYICIPSRGRLISEFKVSLGYRVNSRTARDTQRNHVWGDGFGDVDRNRTALQGFCL